MWFYWKIARTTFECMVVLKSKGQDSNSSYNFIKPGSQSATYETNKSRRIGNIKSSHRGFPHILSTRRYSPLRGPTSNSCGGLRPSAEAFFALRAKKELIMLLWEKNVFNAVRLGI